MAERSTGAARCAALTRGLLVCACLLMASAAWAAHPYQKWADELGIDMNVSYDGTRVMTAKGHSFEATERRAPGKMYTEVNMGQMSSGVILREDLNKAWLLMPTMGMYKEETLEGGIMQSANGLEFQSIEKDGREEFLGFDTTKYKVRFEDNDGKGAGFVWVADEGVPIKMDMIYSNRSMKGERITMEFSELNLRKQDPKWFELPEDLQPMGMSSIGALMGGAMQGGQADAGTAQPANDREMTEEEQRNADRKACLEAAQARAREEQEKAKKKRSFGRLLGSVSRTARRFGMDGVSEVTRDVYDANATANDMEIIAEELGISEDDVQDCYDRY